MLFGDSNILGDRVSGWKRLLKNILVSAVVQRCSAILYCGRLGADYFRQYGATDRIMFPFPYEPDYDCFDAVSPEAIEGLLDDTVNVGSLRITDHYALGIRAGKARCAIGPAQRPKIDRGLVTP